jgi:preprotein translocase subunit SecY
MSIMIFISIVSRIPAGAAKLVTLNLLTILLFLIIALAVVVGVIWITTGERRVPVQYAKRVVGRRMMGGTSTFIPLKVNMAGVIPVIFASSLLYLPALISQFQGNSNAGWVRWINSNFTKGDHPTYMLAYFLLIIFFTYFYVSITFNPDEVADNMKKYGGFIPGIRAGRPTAEYLDYVLTRITLPGALYLGVISLIPLVALALLNANSNNFPFGGTSILIVVGVGLETVKQIESQLQQRHYEGFLR